MKVDVKSLAFPEIRILGMDHSLTFCCILQCVNGLYEKHTKYIHGVFIKTQSNIGNNLQLKKKSIA